MSALDSVASAPQVSFETATQSSESQAPDRPSGIIQGNTLGDVMASDDGQKLLALIKDSIQMNIANDCKRHSKRVIESMKEGRHNRK